MFAGIVQDVGRLVSREEHRGDVRMAFGFDRLDPAGMRLGDSICVQGCCLTVVEFEQRGFGADVSRETLAVTTLGEMQPGARVNLESALRLGESLGGHLVTGHIDGMGRIVAMEEDGRSSRMDVALLDAVLLRYIARKGSIAVDGVSLTVNEVPRDRFRVNLIPHTRAVTTLGSLRPGAFVNVEVDLMARYAERLLRQPSAADSD